MRAFEYVGDGAAKFWQVEQDGTAVTVRHGRIGAAGRAQVRTFASAVEAAAHVDRLVAEKLAKGYAETAAAAGAPGAADPALPDEEIFALPAAWRRGMLPRRGFPGPALPRGPEALVAGEELLASVRAGIERILGHPDSEPDLVDAARAYQAGAPAPLGAAVIAMAAACRMGWQDTDRARALADAWAAAHGVVFAACAAVELAGLTSTESGGAQSLGRSTDDGGHWTYWDSRLAVTRRVRAHLAAADAAEYEAACEALAPYRDATLPVRVVSSFLAHTRSEWVSEDCAAVRHSGHELLARLLFSAANSAEDLAMIAPRLNPWVATRDASLTTSAAAVVGPAIAPVLIDWFDVEYLAASNKQRVLSMVAAFPTDEAMRLLLDRLDRKYVQPALLGMLKRYPVRGVRLLAAAADGGTPAARQAAALLRAHVVTHPAAVAAALPALDAATRQRVEALAAEPAQRPVPAGPEALPPLLVAPPWAKARRRRKPPVLDGLERIVERDVVWRPGEREEWAAAGSWYADGMTDRDPAVLAAEVAARRADPYREVAFFAGAPDELARPLVGAWVPRYRYDAREWLRRVVARFELDALPVALRRARSDALGAGALLLPYADPEVADLMADWLVRLKSLRPVALAWLARHPGVAARALVPAAVGKPGAQRRAAEAALRVVAADHRDLVLDAARGYGSAVAAAVVELLDADPLEQVPSRIPALPEWLEPALLPPVLLRDRSAVLPVDAVRHVCTMLAMSKPGEVYAGIDLVKSACEPGSLAAFAWALFERWQEAGAPSRDGWALSALGWVGDDETARRLASLIRTWPGEGGHSKAVAGLDVLAAIGTDVALMHLYGISQKVKFKGLRERAGERVREVAAQLGLSAEQLGDRLVPDLGLDGTGTLTLDYGPRRFTVGFDEQLKPYVLDEQGTRRKDLPKPGARDDQTLAPEAYRRFAGLKKDVRTLAADQIRRFEAAMVGQRRWPVAEFRRYFVDHPLLWHVVRRLVWAMFLADGTMGTAFRVAEDRTFADVDDEAYALPGEATVGLVHPLHLGGSLPAWAELFADYEILQPFPQLGREVHELTEAERDATTLGRFKDVPVPAARLLGLERRGWRRGEPLDAGVQCWLERELPGGRAVVVNIDPGISVGYVDASPEQRIEEVWVNDRPHGDWRSRGSLRLGVLDPVIASEVLRDLAEVTA